MASWVLRCPSCSQTFEHSKIDDNLANYLAPEKPKFPKGGETLTCTHCGTESLFQRTELVYQRKSFKKGANS
jgi:uncharacterized C2H2 Zn-finger protein